MTEESGPLLSVRGRASREVEPDFVELHGGVVTTADDKVSALRRAAEVLDGLLAGLAELGGVARTVRTARDSLTWSARSAGTSPEHAHDPETGRSGLTGRVRATVDVAVTLRALDRLDELGTVLARVEELDVRRVSWGVDPDNPQWPAVRAEAIQAALRQGRDYAAALGGRLATIEHVSDVGLLGGGPVPAKVSMSGGYASLGKAGGEIRGAAPALDPVPQVLDAVIEARFTTVGVSLDGHDAG